MNLATQKPSLWEVKEVNIQPKSERFSKHFHSGKPLVTIGLQERDSCEPCAIICPELPQIPLNPTYGPLEIQALIPRPQKAKNTKSIRTPAASLAALPQVKPWVATAIKTIFEVFSGRRSAQTVINWFTPDLRGSFLALARAERHRPQPAEIKVRRIFCHKAGTGKYGFEGIEVAVSISDGSRVRAVAMRIKPASKTWKIAALEIG